jgi:hypothetical protein
MLTISDTPVMYSSCTSSPSSSACAPHPPSLPPILHVAQACSYPTAKQYPSAVQARQVIDPGDLPSISFNPTSIQRVMTYGGLQSALGREYASDAVSGDMQVQRSAGPDRYQSAAGLFSLYIPFRADSDQAKAGIDRDLYSRIQILFLLLLNPFGIPPLQQSQCFHSVRAIYLPTRWGGVDQLTDVFRYWYRRYRLSRLMWWKR